MKKAGLFIFIFFAVSVCLFSQNVGIGITDPTHKLHIFGGDLFVQSSSGKIVFGYEGSNQWQLATTGGGADLRWYTSPDGTTINPRHYFSQNGNVGIGGFSGGFGPNARLDVIGIGASSATNNLLLRNSADNILVKVRDDGKMGIGYNGASFGRTVNIGGSGVNLFPSEVSSNISGAIFPTDTSIVIWSDASSDRYVILQPEWGKVGIGTYKPRSMLEVYVDANHLIRLGYGSGTGSYFHYTDEPIYGDGQSAVYAYRTRTEANNGTGYGITLSNMALRGYCFWGDLYSFGTGGFNFNDYTRCGGILGAEYDGTYWGSLGYRSSGSLNYGGYFTSSTTGGGKSSQEAYTGIGMGTWGDLLGADIHGKVYGIYAEGENYALFSHGAVYKDNIDVHLQDNKSGTKTVMYTNVSTDVTIQTSGIATLNAGRASITFDPAFTSIVSSEEPVVVTVTPIGKSQGVYLSDISGSGFTVLENNDGKSNVTVNYIAIGKRAGYENPSPAKEVIDAGYTGNMARGLHNDADTQTNGEGLYYEKGNLVVGIHPSTLPDPDKPSEDEVIPKASEPRREVSQSAADGSSGHRQ